MWGPGVARQSAAMWSMELPPAYGSLGRFPAYSDSQDRINECLCLPELLVYWYNDTGSYHLSVFYAPVRVCVHDFYLRRKPSRSMGAKRWGWGWDNIELQENAWTNRSQNLSECVTYHLEYNGVK